MIDLLWFEEPTPPTPDPEPQADGAAEATEEDDLEQARRAR